MPRCSYQLLSLSDEADEPIVCLGFFFFYFQLSWEISALATKLRSVLSFLGDQDSSFDQGQ